MLDFAFDEPLFDGEEVFVLLDDILVDCIGKFRFTRKERKHDAVTQEYVAHVVHLVAVKEVRNQKGCLLVNTLTGSLENSEFVGEGPRESIHGNKIHRLHVNLVRIAAFNRNLANPFHKVFAERLVAHRRFKFTQARIF